MIDHEKIESTLGVTFTDRSLLETAFTHRSYLNEHQDYPNPSNERLEFLGDAVLQVLTSEHLYHHYQDPEGLLTNYRASLVRTESLAETAQELGYGEFLLLSQGEDASGGRESAYILANTFEAVLGAVYLETDLETCRQFLEKTLFPKIETIIAENRYRDSKSLLQEATQEKFGITPVYQVIKEWGPDHNKHFQVGVHLENKLAATGEGNSKQRAEQMAAQGALEKLEDK